MKKLAKTFSLLLLTIVINSCVDPIEIEGVTSEDFVVIEANLTDELKTQTVKLSRTFALNSDTQAVKETNATVSIKENTNTYAFTEIADGIYTSNIQFKAEAGKEYTLEVKRANGTTYLSRPEKLIGSSEITEITAKKETNNLNEEGIRIAVKGRGLDNDSKYFKYEYVETYKVIPPFWSDSKLKVISATDPFEVEVVPNLDNNRVCYSSIESDEIILKETATLSDDIIDTNIKFIQKKDFIISDRYSILVKQHVQSFEAYNYYISLNKLSTNESLFTQSQPGFLLGNITSATNSNDKAIGYFEITSVTTKRIFFNREDFFEIDDPADFISDCTFFAPTLYSCAFGVCASTSPLVVAIQTNKFILYLPNTSPSEAAPGPYLLVPKECGDCTEIGTNIKPSYWVD